MLKIVFGDMREERLMRVKALLDSHPRYSDFDYIRSEKSLYEILPKGVSKGTVLPRLAEHLGIDMRRTVAIGDYDNDVSILRAAGLGIAVANATASAKEAADLITVSNEEHAIAKIISDIESGKIKI
jgi:hydroxymethylpyrimidine pyrophosphatase-like HAD family hydrolase